MFIDIFNWITHIHEIHYTRQQITRLRTIAVVVPSSDLRFGVVGKFFPYVLGVPIGTIFNVGVMELLAHVVEIGPDAPS